MVRLWIILHLICLRFAIGSPSADSECYSSFLRNCCEGYRLVNNTCVATCKDSCPESEICLEPDICGLQLDPSDFVAASNCSAWRSDFDYCGKCSPSHIFTLGQCEPYCGQKCADGVCVSPGICKCNQGFQENPKTKSCEPISLEPSQDICANGSCSNFDVNFTSSSPNNSENCQNECQDGICIEGLCQFNPTTDSGAIADCQMDCFAGICINGICQKQESSTDFIDMSSNCQNGCWGGDCYEGVCQCKDGLVLDEATNECIIPCKNNCHNGVCNQDRVCECNQGYVLQNDSGCVPQCDRECVNGYCVAPIHCECIEGDIATLNFSSAFECLPTCDGVDGKPDGCLNGTCVAVNKCQCNEGYFLNPVDRFECVDRLTKLTALAFPREFLYLIPIIATLAVIILVVFGCLAYRKVRCVRYNIYEIEKCNSIIVSQNHDQSDCSL